MKAITGLTLVALVWAGPAAAAADSPTVVPASGGGGVPVIYGYFTVPFTEAELAALYPNHGAFAAQYSQASKRAVRSRFLLLPDAIALFRAAAQSDVAR